MAKRPRYSIRLIINRELKHIKNYNFKIYGCYFHFNQNLWKHFQKIYGRSQYKGKLKNFYRYLQALAFVPLQDVVYAFELLQVKAPAEFSPMLDYLEKYYIGLKNPKNLNQRKVPTFPIKI